MQNAVNFKKHVESENLLIIDLCARLNSPNIQKINHLLYVL
jgi:hypothetical protein